MSAQDEARPGSEREGGQMGTTPPPTREVAGTQDVTGQPGVESALWGDRTQGELSPELGANRDAEAERRRESGDPGGGQGRIDEIGRSGVYPASGPMVPDDAEVRPMAAWGQGERRAAGYEDHGESELDFRGFGGAATEGEQRTEAEEGSREPSAGPTGQ